MTARALLGVLVALVGAAAAVLSFSALRDLALACGFDGGLAPLLPVVVDAGAAAGSVAWLGRSAPAAAGYGRVLALGLLVLSVAANALGHGLAAYAARPHWLVVVAVSAVAPVTLGALVHLLVLVGRPTPTREDRAPARDEAAPAGREGEPVLMCVDELAELRASVEAAGGQFDDRGLSRLWDHAPPAEPTCEDRATELIAAGAGRRRLAKELAITEHEARELLARARNGSAP